jgi:ABC-type branched-subunit amino acid transport system substrate-binding protein
MIEDRARRAIIARMRVQALVAPALGSYCSPHTDHYDSSRRQDPWSCCAALCSLTCLAAFSAQAQNTIEIAGLYELSGAGASAGTMFRNGVDLAVREINEAGGILGKKIEHSASDTQTNPGVAKGLASKAVDDGAFAVFGPADISTDSGQVDFSAPVLMAKNANADVLFVYTNEEESARALRELKNQGFAKQVVGETTLTGQKVIELAGDAANGALAHVGLTVDAPNPQMLEFKARFYQETKTISDHNGIKGYTGVYALKAAIEKAGKVDRKAVAQAMKGLAISAARNPGLIFDVAFDDKGDLDRESFIVEVKGGKQEVKEVVPPLSAKKS